MNSAQIPPSAAPHQGSDVVRPVRGGNALEATFEEILLLLRAGAVAPGDRLPAERDLAARLGVSRTTLRGVLADLQAAGYLEVRRGRYGGTFVTGVMPEKGSQSVVAAEDVEGLLRYRRVIEAGAARIAAESALSGEQEARLRAACAEMREAAPEEYRGLDSRFHLEIARAAESQHILAAAIETRALVNDLLNAMPILSTNLAHSNEQHEVIVEAILRGDPEAAERLVREHLDGTEALIRGFVA